MITMLPNGDLVRSVLFGEHGVCEGLSRDALVIDMSTIHPLQTDALIRDMAEQGFSLMDVPVGRTSDHAIAGTLLLLAGGTAQQVERATPVLMAMGNELINAGGPGMGIRVKLINNYMSIALNALSAEAAVLCEALGLSFDVALKVMSGTPAGKGHFTTSWPNKVLKGDLPAFMIDLAHKIWGSPSTWPTSSTFRCRWARLPAKFTTRHAPPGAGAKTGRPFLNRFAHLPG